MIIVFGFPDAKLIGLLDIGIMPKVHQAIDGYSRRILWLEVLNSANNSSGVIAKYYLDSLANLGVCPRLLRCDSGTENAKLSVPQPFFRYNDMNLFLK